MKRRTVTIMRITMTILVLSLFVMATYVTYTNGTLPDVVYNAINSGQQNNAKATVKTTTAKYSFRMPNTMDTKNVFKHSTIPHTNKNSITPETAITNDNQGRISTISYRMTPENAVMYSTETNDWKSVLVTHDLTKDGAKLTFSGEVWVNDIQPYLSAMHKFVTHNGMPLNVVWTFSYENDEDKYPAYAQLEAYTIQSADVNFRISFANTSSYGPINYTTGALYAGKVGDE